MLGGPFAYIFGHVFGNNGEHIATMFGILFAIAAGYKTWQILAKPRFDPLQTAIIFFLSFLVISIIGVTSARMPQGFPVLTNRYTTVSLAGWCSLLILYSAALVTLAERWRALLVLAAIPYMVLAVKAQVRELANWDEPIFEQKVTMLGAALGVRELDGVSKIAGTGWYLQFGLEVLNRAYQQHLGILGWFPYRGSREQLGTRVSSPPDLPECYGVIDGIQTIADPRFVRISGRLSNPASDDRIEGVRFVDKDGYEVGTAIMGQTTPDPDRSLRKRDLHERFRGYILARASGETVTVLGEDRRGQVCHVAGVVPYTLYSAKPATVSRDRPTVTTGDLLPGNEWTGSDAAHTNLCKIGLKVFGSFKSHGDADSGSISLSLKRGDRLLYRSGTWDRQVLEIAGRPSVPLPSTADWVVLDFSGPALPEGQFTAKLTDAGTEPGEWSAIAVCGSKACQ